MRPDTRRRTRTRLDWTVGAAVGAFAVGVAMTAAHVVARGPAIAQIAFADSSGVQATLTTAGSFDTNNPFFQNLGTNGRTCFSCHRPAQGWTMTPDELQQRFRTSNGLDPVFATNDGSNCEGADVSTIEKRQSAFTLLLSKGLIRVSIPLPDNAEFEIVGVDDPYQCGGAPTGPSMYRRPLPATNLRFLSTVMWDGRETIKGQSITSDLAHQALDATTGHAQGAPPSAAVLAQIVNFETALSTAQTIDRDAGSLSSGGASGGPAALASQPFCIGVNDPLGILPSVPGACGSASTGLDPDVFTLFNPWEAAASPARQAIARGETIFNTRTFVVDDVPGLNAAPGDPVQGPISTGTCTLCHDTPNAGNHSISMPLDIGIASAGRRTPDLPLYTLRNKITGETVLTTDPGRAMVTGKWTDISKFKGPTLRALATRAPYFHNGSAATLDEVVEFYDTRFHLGLTAAEKADLVAFLKAL